MSLVLAWDTWAGWGGEFVIWKNLWTFFSFAFFFLGIKSRVNSELNKVPGNC